MSLTYDIVDETGTVFLQISNCLGQKELMREAEIMKSLNHPNIVGYFNSLRIGKYFTIVLEWLPGLLSVTV